MTDLASFLQGSSDPVPVGPPAGWTPEEAAERIRAAAREFPEYKKALKEAETGEAAHCRLCELWS